MNPETIEFRKLVFLTMEESFKDGDNSFWDSLGINDTSGITKEDAMLDMVEILQLIVGMYFRRMAIHFAQESEDVFVSLALESLGNALLDDLQKIN